MERALIIGASGGLGAALSRQLLRQGVEVVGVSRSADGLDFQDPAKAEALLAAIEGPFDLVIVATGALTVGRARPDKSLAELRADEMAAQFAVNAIGPALVMTHAKRWLRRRGRSVFAVLSARVGSIEDNRLGGWYSYRASKAALNQLLKTGAIELARTHKNAICVALHPGTVATSFTSDFAAPKKLAPTESASRLIALVDGLEAHQTGAFFDWKGERIPW